MKRPRQKSRYLDKAKSLDRDVPQAFLAKWATEAKHESSDYHCYGPKGSLQSPGEAGYAVP